MDELCRVVKTHQVAISTGSNILLCRFDECLGNGSGTLQHSCSWKKNMCWKWSLPGNSLCPLWDEKGTAWITWMRLKRLFHFNKRLGNCHGITDLPDHIQTLNQDDLLRILTSWILHDHECLTFSSLPAMFLGDSDNPLEPILPHKKCRLNELYLIRESFTTSGSTWDYCPSLMVFSSTD